MIKKDDINYSFINEPRRDFQQYGSLTGVDLEKPVQPAFKLRKSK